MRGDIVIVDFPFSDASQAKRRPALILQGDGVLSVNTMIALITSNIQRTGATRLVVDPALETGSGLRAVSAVARESLFSLHKRLIVKRIGSLSSVAMAQIDDCLKIALGLP
jgi:mRNA interferase MazF